GDRGAYLIAGRPDDAVAWNDLAVLKVEALGRHARRARRLELDTALQQLLLRVGGEIRRGLGQYRAPHQDEPDRVAGNARVVAKQDAARQLFDGRGQLGARVTGAGHDAGPP